MRGLALILAGLTAVVTLGAVADGPAFHFPQVKKYGGIAQVPNATESPRLGTKIIFDITAVRNQTRSIKASKAWPVI